MQTTPETFQQNSSASMTYPRKGTLNRLIFKTPLILWRMGLGPILSHPALAGSKILALTTWGRKSHLPRHTMLSYIQLDGKVFVSSGWGARTDWYQNIMANSIVTVQVRRKVYSAKARRVEDLDEFTRITVEMFESGGDSHFESWLESYGVQFDPADMIAKRERLVLVAFDPCAEVGPPSLPADLVLLWAWLPLTMIAVWLLKKRRPCCQAG